MSATLELVTFRTTRSGQEFIDANASINDWLKRQPGFMSRHLAERDDGSFVDIVFWRTREEALAASGKIMEEMAQSEAMTMIDPMSLQMSHGNIRFSVD